MKISKGVLIATIGLIVWLILSWLLGTWLHLKSPNIWILRGGLAFIGIIGFVGYLLLRPKPARPEQPSQANLLGEIDFIFSEATQRLRAANLTKAKSAAGMPAIFVLGDSNTAKTSVLAHSGLEPELLAGQAYQDNVVTPTRAVNMWYARQTVFIDPAGKIIADAGARRRLFHKFAPVGVSSVLGGSAPAARAVVITLDCEAFLQAGSSEALSGKARQLQSLLGELSVELGTSLPVYVLFTKADRLPYFREFVENLTEAEAAEIFGVTLPLQPTQAGVYAEEQSRRLTEAFQSLYHSLADRRPNFLAREHDGAKLPNIYEFPREFNKLRPLLVQFLVDLCRPSQLRTNAYLRGFYFTGVRPVVVNDLAPAAMPQVQPEPAAFDAGATRIFSRRQTGSPLADTPQSASRKVPQWVFLSHLFSDLILADRPALGLTQSSTKVSFWRRALMATAALAALFLCVVWTLSFSGNHSLVTDATEAAKAVPPVGLQSTQIASRDSLQRLDHVREQLALLNGYERDGAPWRLRWGLYFGSSVRQPLRQVYYALFRKLLLLPTQETLITLTSNPPQANDIANYRLVYDGLKAYLITTNHHEKSTRDFLSPVLQKHWLNNRQVDNDVSGLAQKQFDFYSDDLVESNPYPRYAQPNANAVSTARLYLNKFPYLERVYQGLLADAAKNNPAIVFNKLYPGSAEVVINSFPVEGAFTKGGYIAFNKELQDPDRYFSGEAWVLGPASPSNLEDKRALAAQIQQRYRDDFINAWRGYMKATVVVPYHSIGDAVGKLGKMASNQSPLLGVLCVASENTSIDQKAIADLFQPPQLVTPNGCHDKLASAGNAPYMDGLTRLQTALQQVSQNQANDGARQEANNVATSTQATVLQMARNFPVDRDGGVDTKTASILQDPLTRVPPLLAGAEKGPINAGAKGLCGQMNPMLSKYPFNPRSTADATLPEVISILKPPDGALWGFYNMSLQKLIAKQGDQYVPIQGQSMTISPHYLLWFNRAAHMSDVLFKSGAAQPSFNFAIKPAPSDDVEGVTLEINGQTAKYPKGGGNFQQFAWPGSMQDVHLRVRFVGGSELDFPKKEGLWAVFRWLDDGEHFSQQGSNYSIEWTLRTTGGPVTIPQNGHPATVRFILDPMGSPVRPGFFPSLGCVSPAVQ